MVASVFNAYQDQFELFLDHPDLINDHPILQPFVYNLHFLACTQQVHERQLHIQRYNAEENYFYNFNMFTHAPANNDSYENSFAETFYSSMKDDSGNENLFSNNISIESEMSKDSLTVLEPCSSADGQSSQGHHFLLPTFRM